LKPLTFGYFYSRKLRKLLPEIIKNKEIDLVFASCSSTGQYLFEIPYIGKAIDFIDIDSRKWLEFSKVSKFPNSFIFRLEHKRLGIAEGKISKLCENSVVTTERERQELIKLDRGAQDKCSVIPIGVDLDYFSSAEIPRAKTKATVLFVGQLDYLPNVDAVLFFYLRIFPILRSLNPDVEFQIVGRSPHPAISGLCTQANLIGEVADVRPYFRNATVFVAPFRLAFGIQSKIVEAMASEIPVVATSLVLQGLPATPGENILIADDPHDFAKAVSDLLNSEEKQREISQNAMLLVKDVYNWERNVSKLAEVLAIASSTIPKLAAQ